MWANKTYSYIGVGINFHVNQLGMLIRNILGII